MGIDYISIFIKAGNVYVKIFKMHKKIKTYYICIRAK